MSRKNREGKAGRLFDLLLLAGLGLQLGCGDLLWDDPEPYVPTANLSGDWTVRGSGIRSHCSEELYNGNFNLRLASRLAVTQTPSAEHGVYRLQLAEEVEMDGARLVLSGGVQSDRVDFTLREERDESPTAEFRFSGTWHPTSSTIEGDFTGEGPMGCMSTGGFTVDVDRSAGSTGAS